MNFDFEILRAGYTNEININILLTLLHSEGPKQYGVLAVLSATGLIFSCFVMSG